MKFNNKLFIAADSLIWSGCCSSCCLFIVIYLLNFLKAVCSEQHILRLTFYHHYFWSQVNIKKKKTLIKCYGTGEDGPLDKGNIFIHFSKTKDEIKLINYHIILFPYRLIGNLLQDHCFRPCQTMIPPAFSS